MASSLENTLLSNELTYDFSGFDVDMNDLWEKNANKGQSTYASWDEESGNFYLATVEPHSEMDLALSGQTIEDISTVDYSEPVYFTGAGSHEMGEVSRQWTVEDSGTVNMSEGWMTESQLREQWDADEGMGAFKKANPDMGFDAYFEMLKDGTSRYQAAGGVMAGEQESFLAELAADHGVQTTWQNGDGDVFNFTGSGYAKTFKVDDHAGPGDYMKMAMMAAVGWAAGPALTSALTSSLGAAGAKAASSAIINLAKSYVTTGELSIEDALMSAALSYGGSELSDALQGSGVIGDIGSKVTDFGNDLASNGGDILKSALTAGGMSLVSQMVKDGEIDWKDAAIAAAMAGGTTALQGFLSDIGKADAEGEVLEEIKVTAQHKGTKVGEDMYQLEDGTVIYAPADGNSNVLGNMADLDTDGDGLLNANDLQEIDVTHGYVSTNPNSGEYLDYDSGENAFREGGTYYISEDGVVHQQGDFTYVDGGPNGTYLVKDAQGNEFYVTEAEFTADGRFKTASDTFYTDSDGNRYTVLDEDSSGNALVQFDEDGNPFVRVDDGSGNLVDKPLTINGEGEYVAVNGYYNAADGKVYDNIEDYTSVNAITDNTENQLTPTWGQNPNWSNDPDYKGTIYTVDGEQDIYHNLETGFYTKDADGNVAVVNVNDIPEEVKQEVADSSDVGGNSASDSPNTNNNPADSVPPDVTNPDVNSPASNIGGLTPAQIAQIAQIAGTTVVDVINRINSGETVQDIVSNTGDIPVTPSGENTTDKEATTETPATTPNAGNETNTQNPNTTPSSGEAYEARIQALMERGMSREQAERNQAHAIEVGGDFDGDGAVTDAEWSQLQSNQNGNDTDPNNTAQDPKPPGQKPGNEGTGGGDGDGDGDGKGDGNGLGNGDGLMALAGAGNGRDRPVWGQLLAPPKFKPHTPYQSKVTQSLFGDLMGTDWLRGRR